MLGDPDSSVPTQPASDDGWLIPLSTLDGQEIVRWVGTEMAVSGGEPVDEGEPTVYSPVCWYHESVPYLQLCWLDIQLADGLRRGCRRRRS